MGNPYTARLVPQAHYIDGTSIANGVYDFSLDVDRNPRETNIFEYFYFVDSDGDVVPATAGTVVIQGSPDGGKTYQDFRDNSFAASSALSPSRAKPSGIGKTTHVRITLSGTVVAPNAVGFSTLLNQIAGV